MNRWKRQQHHQRLSDNLAGKVVEAAKCEPKEQERVRRQARETADRNGEYKTAPRQRRIDRKIRQFRE